MRKLVLHFQTLGVKITNQMNFQLKNIFVVCSISTNFVKIWK